MKEGVVVEKGGRRVVEYIDWVKRTKQEVEEFKKQMEHLAKNKDPFMFQTSDKMAYYATITDSQNNKVAIGDNVRFIFNEAGDAVIVKEI